MTELELIRKAKRNDPLAIDQLVNKYTFLIVSILKKNNYDINRMSDYISAGKLAILKALKTFNPKFGTKFVTWCYGSIRTDLRKESKLDYPIAITLKGKKDGVELSYEDYYDQLCDNRLPTDTIMFKEQQRELIAKLKSTLFKKLSALESKVVVDYYIHQKSAKELRSKYGNYNYILHCAIKKCRISLDVLHCNKNEQPINLCP